MMRASVFIATSLDGYIARPDGALDWLPSGSEDEDHGFEPFLHSVDALVMGRKTFETVLGFGPDAWPYGAKPVYVLSSTLREARGAPGAVCEVLRGPVADAARALDRRGVRDAYVDGGQVVTGFLEAGLVHRLVITRIPVLLGAGIPLFGPLSRDLRFAHVATRAFRNGMVQSEYRAEPAPGPAPRGS
jgi:dihydrofolate reductase